MKIDNRIYDQIDKLTDSYTSESLIKLAETLGFNVKAAAIQYIAKQDLNKIKEVLKIA